MKKKTWGENKNSSWPLGIKTGSLGDKVAVRKEAVRRGTAQGPGQERSWTAPRVLDKKLEKGCCDTKREGNGIASS